MLLYGREVPIPGYHRVEMLLAELEQVGSLTGPGEAPSD